MQTVKPTVLGTLALYAVALAAGTAAWADDGITTTVSGFGTAGGTLTSNGTYQYRHDSTEFSGAGSSFDAGLESRLGVQAVVDFGHSLSFTAQEVLKQRGVDTFSPGTEWLFLQYAPTPNVLLHLGRFAIDTFLFSDVINVGYATNWFRAPNEVYGSEPFKYIDGAQVIWRTTIGPVNLKFEGASGTSAVNLQIGGIDITQSAKYAYNGALTLEYGSFLLNLAKTNIDAPLTLPIGPHGLTYETRDRFTAYGFQYDNGTAVLLSEWTRRTQNDVPVVKKPLAASSQWYAAGGWHFGKLTPMITYGEYLPRVELIAPPGSFHTWSEGLRYDILNNIALKAEYSRVQAGNARYWVTPNTKSSANIGVFSLGADFVF